MFGKYRIISTLGAGSSSTVYLAEHLKLKVHRAIKCIPKCTGTSFHEADLLKTLNHPGIPLIYDIDEDFDFIYMVEEFVQGDSLETLVLHQENISQELIIEYGIQLCDILDYLHHLAPYPILYQDLKPEHIILCGNQIKLVDFGIASFITGSGKIFQSYGTDGFVPPEALHGQPVGPSSDLFSLGQILSYMVSASGFICSSQLLRIIEKASAPLPEKRYQTAADLQTALCELAETSDNTKSAVNNACQQNSHPIRNIAVIGSRSGVGATHFAVSFATILNRHGQKCAYVPMDCSDNLDAMSQANIFWKEKNGIFYYKHFSGTPNYGAGVENPLSGDYTLVHDYGCCLDILSNSDDYDLLIFIMSGSCWDMPATLTLCEELCHQKNMIFICNYDNKKAAKKYARRLQKTVYCFPIDSDPFHISFEKERLISQILNRKEVNHHFWHWRKHD